MQQPPICSLFFQSYFHLIHSLHCNQRNSFKTQVQSHLSPHTYPVSTKFGIMLSLSSLTLSSQTSLISCFFFSSLEYHNSSHLDYNYILYLFWITFSIWNSLCSLISWPLHILFLLPGSLIFSSPISPPSLQNSCLA